MKRVSHKPMVCICRECVTTAMSSELPRPVSIMDPTFELEVRKLTKQALERVGSKHDRRARASEQRPAIGASFAPPDAAAVGAVVPDNAATLLSSLRQSRALFEGAESAVRNVRDRKLALSMQELEEVYDAAWDAFDVADRLTDLLDSFVE